MLFITSVTSYKRGTVCNNAICIDMTVNEAYLDRLQIHSIVYIFTYFFVLTANIAKNWFRIPPKLTAIKSFIFNGITFKEKEKFSRMSWLCGVSPFRSPAKLMSHNFKGKKILFKPVLQVTSRPKKF